MCLHFHFTVPKEEVLSTIVDPTFEQNLKELCIIT